MRAKVLFFILFLFSLSSCKKDKIEISELPENNDPIFYVQGKIDGEEVFQRAGENEAVVVNGVTNRNGMDFTFGEFQYDDKILRLGIFDGNEEMPNLSTLLGEGDSLKLAGKIIESLANFNKDYCSNSSNITEVKWFKDGQFVGYDQFDINTPGKYEICGEFTFYDGSTKRICNEVLVGFYQDMQLEMKHFMLGAGSAKLWLAGVDTAKVKSVEWRKDNVVVSNAIAPIINVSTSSKSIISARIESKSGKIYTRSILVDGANLGFYTEDFNLFIKPNEVVWDYAVGIDIRKSGQWFSTFNAQNYKSSVVVDKIDFYEVNSQGEKVYKIEGRIDAKLSTLDQGSSFLINLKFVYPMILK